jgi:hypothetical protein
MSGSTKQARSRLWVRVCSPALLAGALLLLPSLAQSSPPFESGAPKGTVNPYGNSKYGQAEWAQVGAGASDLKPGETEILGEIKFSTVDEFGFYGGFKPGTEIRWETGDPIPGATIYVDTNVRGAIKAQSNALGLFRVVVPFDTFRALRIAAPGFAAEEFPIETIFGWLRKRSKKQDAPKMIYLNPGVAVSGSVSSWDRSSVSQVSVRCLAAGIYNSPAFYASEISDAEGRFTVDCPAETHVKFHGTRPDYRIGVTDWIDLKQASAPRPQIHLERGTRLTGRVLDEAGKPTPHAGLILYDLTHPTRALHAWSEAALYLDPFGQSRYTELDGSFDFGILSAHVTLRARALDGAEQKVDLELGSMPTQYVELNLESGVTVSGMVRFDGAPAPRVLVGWRCDGKRTRLEGPRLTSEDGSFVLKQLSDSYRQDSTNCRVLARPRGEGDRWLKKEAMDGFLSTQLLAPPGASDLILKLKSEDPGRLELRFDNSLHRKTGVIRLTPIGELKSTTPAIDYDLRRMVTSATEVVFPELRAGHYRLEWEIRRGAKYRPSEVVIQDGRTTKFTLTLSN